MRNNVPNASILVALLGSGCAITVPPGQNGGGGTDDATYVQITDRETDVAAYAQDSSGAILGVVAEKDTEGDPIRLKSAYYKEASGSEWAVMLGDDGLPSQATSNGWLFVFDNWSTRSVDLSIVSPDGATARYLGIDAPSEEIGVLSRAAAQRFLKTGQMKVASQQKGIVSDFLKWGAAAMSVVTCVGVTATAITVTAGTGGLAFPTLAGVALTCGSAGVSIGNLVWATDESRDLGTGLSVVSCATGNCQGIAVNVATRITEFVEHAASQSAAQVSRDSDGDGIPDYRDNCPNTFNPGLQLDSDGDGTGDQCDSTPLGGDSSPSVDSDGDGVADVDDGCPNDPDKTNPGECGCGEPDSAECPLVFNEVEPNDDEPTANHISFPMPGTMTLNGLALCGEFDYYSFDAARGQRFRRQVSGSFSYLGALSLSTYVIDSSGNKDSFNTWDVDHSFIGEFAVPSDGRVYVRVRTQSCDGGDTFGYSVTIEAL